MAKDKKTIGEDLVKVTTFDYTEYDEEFTDKVDDVFGVQKMDEQEIFDIMSSFATTVSPEDAQKMNELAKKDGGLYGSPVMIADFADPILNLALAEMSEEEIKNEVNDFINLTSSFYLYSGLWLVREEYSEFFQRNAGKLFLETGVVTYLIPKDINSKMLDYKDYRMDVKRYENSVVDGMVVISSRRDGDLYTTYNRLARYLKAYKETGDESVTPYPVDRDTLLALHNEVYKNLKYGNPEVNKYLN